MDKVARCEVVCDAVFGANERLVFVVRVKVAKHDLFNAVLFYEVGKRRVVVKHVKWREVHNHNYLLVVLALANGVLKRKFKPYHLAVEDFFVGLCFVVAVWDCPPASAAYYRVAKFDGVVLDGVHIWRECGAQCGYALPPVVVVSAQKHLFAPPARYEVEVSDCVLKIHRPRNVAGDKYYVVVSDGVFVKTARDVVEIVCPHWAENVHGFLAVYAKMQVAYGKYSHMFSFYNLILPQSGRARQLFLPLWRTFLAHVE